MWRLANYDKQMRLGNVAVDNCISQGLPDFYFSLSSSLSLFFFPCFFLSLAQPFYSTPRAPFAPSCSLPLSLPRRRERKDGCSVEEAAVAAEEEEAHTETLICFFHYSPYFPRRRGCCGRCLFSHRSLTSSVTTFRLFLSLLHVLARAFLHASPHPNARLQLCNGFSAPRTAVYFYCNVPLPPIPSSFPRIPTTISALELPSSFYLRFSPATFFPFFFLSFFLLFLLSTTLTLSVVSNFTKGWRRECAPRPSCDGVFFLLLPPAFSSICASSTYNLRFSFFFRPTPLLFLAYTRRVSR